MCIMTDSMIGWPAAPAHAQHGTHGDAPSTPQKGKREKERQRHGDTATHQHQWLSTPGDAPVSTRPACYGTACPEDAPAANNLHHRQPAPAISTNTATTGTTSRPPAAPAPRCTTETATSTRRGEREKGKGRGKGEGAKRKSPAPRRQSHKRPNPATYTTSAHQHRPAVAILPALDRLHLSPFQFCFWRENRTPATSTPDYRREREPRPPAQHIGTGGAFTFSMSRSILQIDSVPSIPHVPLIFTR